MHKNLHALTERIDHLHETAASTRDLAVSVRDALAREIKRPEFALDCLERVLQSPCYRDIDTGWLNPPIHQSERHHYRIKVFFWQPHFANAPHRHNTWSVTGVLHNKNSVSLYRDAEDPEAGGRFILEREIAANAGDVGYLLPPCTHSVGNPSDGISITVHVFSRSDQPDRRGDDTVHYVEEETEKQVESRARALYGSAALLGSIRHPRSLQLLEYLYRLGNPDMKRACLKAMKKISLETV